MALIQTTFQVLLFYIYFIQSRNASPVERPSVDTTLGLIRGLKADDGDYNMFMGIPYARVNPSNPFGDAIPHEPFDSEYFDAIDDSSICPQVEEFNKTIVGSVECLHLNIYAPTTASPDNPKAVMVMIYGGGFSIGFAGRYLYGPEYLVRHDVILVTLNYRLGPYGFMCLDIPEIAGNQGLKDQLLALRWINENIEAFGGDRSRVTAFGNSAGGMAVDYHLVSKHEKLFTQAILQSGTALGINIYSPPNRNAPLQLASYLGFETDDIHEAVVFLAGVPEHRVIEVTSTHGLSFGPCVEKQFDGVDGFLLENWVTAPIPKAKKMPFIFGMMDDEMLASINSVSLLQESLIPSMLSGSFNIEDPGFNNEMVEIIHQFYFGDEKISSGNAFDVVDFMSDAMFNHQIFRSIDKCIENECGDIFFYFFSYVGERNFVRHKDNLDVGGAAHADELGYLFDISYFDTPNDEDQLFIDRLTTLWTNFAKFGNPTPESSELLPVIWEPIKKDSPCHFLELNTNLIPGTRPFHDRMTFWDLLFKTNAEFLVTPSSD